MPRKRVGDQPMTVTERVRAHRAAKALVLNILFTEDHLNGRKAKNNLCPACGQELVVVDVKRGYKVHAAGLDKIGRELVDAYAARRIAKPGSLLKNERTRPPRAP